MTNDERIEDIAQKIFRTWNGRTNSVTGTQLTNFINDSIGWINEFLPELEKETDWDWSRENDYVIGVANSSSTAGFELDDDVRKVVKDPERPVYILDSNGKLLSTWDVVTPGQLKNPKETSNEDRCAVVGRTLKFSRAFTDTENGSSVYGDVIYFLPELSSTNTEVLDIVKPVSLIILGVAKNQALPNVVKKGLVPTLTQKYADLLNGAKAENSSSSTADTVDGENYGYIQGIW